MNEAVEKSQSVRGGKKEEKEQKLFTPWRVATSSIDFTLINQ